MYEEEKVASEQKTHEEQQQNAEKIRAELEENLSHKKELVTQVYRQ